MTQHREDYPSEPALSGSENIASDIQTKLDMRNVSISTEIPTELRHIKDSMANFQNELSENIPQIILIRKALQLAILFDTVGNWDESIRLKNLASSLSEFSDSTENPKSVRSFCYFEQGLTLFWKRNYEMAQEKFDRAYDLRSNIPTKYDDEKYYAMMRKGMCMVYSSLQTKTLIPLSSLIREETSIIGNRKRGIEIIEKAIFHIIGIAMLDKTLLSAERIVDCENSLGVIFTKPKCINMGKAYQLFKKGFGTLSDSSKLCPRFNRDDLRHSLSWSNLGMSIDCYSLGRKYLRKAKEVIDEIYKSTITYPIINSPALEPVERDRKPITKVNETNGTTEVINPVIINCETFPRSIIYRLKVYLNLLDLLSEKYPNGSKETDDVYLEIFNMRTLISKNMYEKLFKGEKRQYIYFEEEYFTCLRIGIFSYTIVDKLQSTIIYFKRALSNITEQLKSHTDKHYLIVYALNNLGLAMSRKELVKEDRQEGLSHLVGAYNMARDLEENKNHNNDISFMICQNIVNCLDREDDDFIPKELISSIFVIKTIVDFFRKNHPLSKIPATNVNLAWHLNDKERDRNKARVRLALKGIDYKKFACWLPLDKRELYSFFDWDMDPIFPIVSLSRHSQSVIDNQKFRIYDSYIMNPKLKPGQREKDRNVDEIFALGKTAIVCRRRKPPEEVMVRYYIKPVQEERQKIYVKYTQEASRHPGGFMALLAVKHRNGIVDVDTEYFDFKPIAEIVSFIPSNRRVDLAKSLAFQLFHYLLYLQMMGEPGHGFVDSRNIYTRRDGRITLNIPGQLTKSAIIVNKTYLQNSPYIAPERKPDSFELSSISSDVYGIGVVIFSILTGKVFLPKHEFVQPGIDDYKDKKPRDYKPEPFIPQQTIEEVAEFREELKYFEEKIRNIDEMKRICPDPYLLYLMTKCLHQDPTKRIRPSNAIAFMNMVGGIEYTEESQCLYSLSGVSDEFIFPAINPSKTITPWTQRYDLFSHLPMESTGEEQKICLKIRQILLKNPYYKVARDFTEPSELNLDLIKELMTTICDIYKIWTNYRSTTLKDKKSAVDKPFREYIRKQEINAWKIASEIFAEIRKPSEREYIEYSNDSSDNDLPF